MPETSNLFTGRIRIITTPKGEAPVDIREAWIGLELPCHCILDPVLGFVVKQADAIAILDTNKPAAATWWRMNGFPRNDLEFFAFERDEAYILDDSVRQAVIREAGDGDSDSEK